MNSKFYTKEQILKTLKNINLLESIEKGFVEYSRGNSVVPPVGELLFEEPPGDVHIKYGYIKNQDNYVVKIASGFSENYRYPDFQDYRKYRIASFLDSLNK